MTLVTILVALSSGEVPVQADRDAQKDIVRKFVTAFFSEDEKTLLGLSSGRAAADFRSYFWIRRRIHGEEGSPPRKWSGDIEVSFASREKILSTEVELIEQPADIFLVKVQDKKFRIGLDDQKSVILFGDPLR